MGHYGSGESRPCRGTALVGHALDRRQPSVIEIRVSAAAVEHGLVVNVTGEGRAVYLWPAPARLHRSDGRVGSRAERRHYNPLAGLGENLFLGVKLSDIPVEFFVRPLHLVVHRLEFWMDRIQVVRAGTERERESHDHKSSHG